MKLKLFVLEYAFFDGFYCCPHFRSLGSLGAMTFVNGATKNFFSHIFQ